MVNVVNTTRPRVPLRILVRVSPFDLAALGERLVAYKVVILGAAKKEYWNALWRAGDLEAFAWVNRSEVNLAIDALRSVPEVVEVKVLAQEVSAPLITIEALLGSARKEKWTTGPSLADVSEEKPFRFDLGESSVLFVRMAGQIQAFENACAHQGLPLERGFFDTASGTITCPWHGFRFDCMTGECLTAPQAQLKTIPVRVVDGTIQVRLP